MVIAARSLSSHLKLIQAHMPSALIDDEQWRKILAIGEVIPSATTHFFILECRLGDPAAKADFSLCADAAAAGRRVLAANAYGIDLPQGLYDHPIWQNLRQFSTNWESEASVLYQEIARVWLEFDTATSSNENLPIPSCFFSPHHLSATPALQHPHPYAYVWDTAIPLLSGQQLPESVKQKLMQCIEYLPENACVPHIGLMLARKNEDVRLSIRTSPDTIANYLRQLKWQGDITALEMLLSDIAEVIDQISLNIDVSDRIQPKIGLECYLFKQPKYDDRWHTFFNSLILQGHCLVEKYQALLDYPGCIRQHMAPSLWPSDVSKLEELLGPKYEWVFFKGLNHIKLVYQDRQVKEAKAYLYAGRSLISSIVQEPKSSSSGEL